MHPPLVPSNKDITYMKDLDHINQKLSTSGIRDTTVRALKRSEGSVVSRSTDSKSCQSSNVPESGTPITSNVSDNGPSMVSNPTTPSIPDRSLRKRPKQLDLTFSDSKARCTSEDCPLRGIHHNVGRYFHNGADGLQNKNTAQSQFFNYTVPPPKIVAAWMRMTEAAESQDDRDQMRQYQKHHTWSPINSEPSSPLEPMPKRAVPVHDAGTADGGYNDMPRIEVSRPTYDRPTRPLCPADFADSDDEDDNSNGDDSNCSKGDVGIVHLPDILQCPEAEMRKIQLRLQAKILREIAELVHVPGAVRGPWDEVLDG